MVIAVAAACTGRSSAAAHQLAAFIVPTWGRLNSHAGWRLHPIERRWKVHWGIDIAAAAGTPVLASATGRVRYAGWYGSYGITVVLEHGDWATVYGHLARVTVQPGQYVAQGTIVGTVGSTGASTNPHLHFELRYRGVPVNPLAHLGR